MKIYGKKKYLLQSIADPLQKCRLRRTVVLQYLPAGPSCSAQAGVVADVTMRSRKWCKNSTPSFAAVFERCPGAAHHSVFGGRSSYRACAPGDVLRVPHDCLGSLQDRARETLGIRRMVGRRRREQFDAGFAWPPLQPCVSVTQVLDRNRQCGILRCERRDDVQQPDHDLARWCIGNAVGNRHALVVYQIFALSSPTAPQLWKGYVNIADSPQTMFSLRRCASCEWASDVKAADNR